MVDDLLSLLPHRPPFIMIGRLLSADETNACTSYRIPADNLFVENGKWSESGLLENMAQTVAAGAGYRALSGNLPVQTGFIAAIKNYEVIDVPAVGDELITETAITDRIANMIRVRGTVRCEQRLIASCEMNIFIGSQP